MNPITNIRNLNKMNEREMALGVNTKSSWHQKYSDSAWIYIGGLDYGLNEGDVISVFSQYGEVVNINLIRDKKTGKSRGFAFLCYEDQRSTVLAVDNINGISLVRRLLRVDHVEEYKVPKYREDVNEETLKLWTEGCAPKPIEVGPARQKSEERESTSQKTKKDRKKEKKLAKQMKKEKKRLEKKEIEGLDQGLMEIGQIDDELKDILKKRKEERRKKKEEKKRMIRGEEMEDRSGMEKDDWKEQKGMFMDRRYEGEEFDYSEKFGKRKTPEPEEQKFNVRPDFDKADWRDIELFKIVREHSQKKNVEWKEEEHYVPKRFG
ncbi:hypothetical protein QR680_017462 [Steinernema hermaphroditum]|uniref:RRM domain-containing protein n=1 Tax=Steinernema hermaphroditum TaxID=289476 RepID=A0AA39HEN0_9BILA|nr:hypothetical protein QR680_017462 [Steinernema hermaphroditum]